MRIRSFLILCALAGGAVVTTAIVVGQQERPSSTIASGGPVFPGLVDRLRDVATVVVQAQGAPLTVRRVDGGWGLADRGDYPVEPDAVPALARSLVQLEKIEPKTDQPALYKRIGVEDLDAPAARSTEVTLKTADGATIANLIVGEQAADVGTSAATYIRIPGEAQSWLARGTIEAHADPRDWVQKRLFDIPAADIREIKVVHPDKSTVTVLRDTGAGTAGGPGKAAEKAADGTPPGAEGAGGEGMFRLAEVPPAKMKLKRPDGIESMTEALSNVMLDDLADAGSHQFPADKTTHVKVIRTDGTAIAFDLVEQDNGLWLRFAPDAAPASLPAAGRSLVFRVPTWKFSPLERKLSEIVETPS